MNIDSLLEPYIAQIFEAGRQKGIAERAGGSVEKYLNPAAHPRINGKFVKIPEGNTPNWGVPAPGATPVPASASAKPAAPSVPLTASADPMEAVLGAMLLHAVECAQSDQNAVPGLKVLVGLVRDRAQLAKASGVPHATVEKSYWAMVECAWSSEKHPRGKNGRFIAIGRIEQARVDPKVAQQLRREVKPEDRAKLDDAIGGVHEDMPKTVKGQKRIAAHQRRLSKQESRERMEVLKGKLARHGDMKYELTPRDLHEFAELLPGMRVQELRGLRKLFNKNIVSRIGWDGARTQDKMAHRLVGFVHARLATMEGPQPEDKAAAQEPETEEDAPEEGDTVESPEEPEASNETTDASEDMPGSGDELAGDSGGDGEVHRGGEAGGVRDSRRGQTDTSGGDDSDDGTGRGSGSLEGRDSHGRGAETGAVKSGMGRMDVANLLASQHHNKDSGRTPEDWADKWVASDKFTKMEIPIDAVSPATQVEDGAESRSSGPIVVDANINETGRYAGAFGAPPNVIILDGKHRHAQAKRAGKRTIEAMVGDKARPHIEAALKAHREATEKASEAVRRYAESQDGSTLRGLRVALPLDEVERIRSAVKGTKGGKPIPPEVLADYPDLAGKDAPPAVDAKVNSAKADVLPESAKKKAHEYHPDEYRKMVSQAFVEAVNAGESGYKAGSVKLDDDGELLVYRGKKHGFVRPASFENIWSQVAHDLGAPHIDTQKRAWEEKTEEGRAAAKKADDERESKQKADEDRRDAERAKEEQATSEPHTLTKGEYEGMSMPLPDPVRNAKGHVRFTRAEAEKYLKENDSDDVTHTAMHDYDHNNRKTGGFTLHPVPTHKKLVKDALAAGKRIPPEVLADYPDLAGKDAPPAVDAKVNSAKADLPKPAPGVNKGGEFRPEQAIKIAADNIGSLRKPDVFRVLDWAPAEHREKLANYITSNRPELADEVKDVMADVGGSSPVPAQSPSPRVAPEANQSNGDRTEGSTPSTGGHQSASVATPKKWHEAADDYISAVQSGHSIPDAAPEALRDVARRLMNAPSQWHAGIELPNAPTGKSLVDKIGKQEGTGKISREALARTLVDKGWYTDTKHMVKATPQMMEHAKQTGLADAVGRALPVDDIIKSVSGSAQPGELVASKFGDTAGHHVLAKSEDGRTHAVLNGQYVANILKLYPQAKPFVPHGNKAVLFKQDGEVVGLVMPFGGHDEKKAPDINPGKRFSLPDVLEKGPYNPEDATETHNGFQVGSGDDAMTVKVTGNPKAGFNIPDYSDTTYPTRALATKAAKELLAHAHGKDEGGNLVFKPKGQKTELAGPEKQRYELYKELGERVKSHGAKKPVAMKWGEGDDSTSRDVVPITEHFGVSQSVPDANGKGEKSWQLIHTPTGMTVPSGWKKKNDAIGHAILLQNLPDANWSTITDDTIENDKDRLKAIGKRAHALKEAYQDERLHQDMKLHK